MNNPLLPVLDANREVLRVAPRRERHLWHLFLAATTTAGPPVTRLDRLARSTRDFLNALAAITGKDYAEEALSVVHSLNLRSALGIFF